MFWKDRRRERKRLEVLEKRKLLYLALRQSLGNRTPRSDERKGVDFNFSLPIFMSFSIGIQIMRIKREGSSRADDVKIRVAIDR